MHWATLHGINCIQSSCMESTAFNRDAFYRAVWSILYSITLHGIHCIQLGSLRQMQGSLCIQSGCFGPRCIKSTSFNRDALGLTAWNLLHSIMLDGIHCIQPGCILPCCMECTAFNHAAWNSLHSIGIQCIPCSVIECSTFHAAW